MRPTAWPWTRSRRSSQCSPPPPNKPGGASLRRLRRLLEQLSPDEPAADLARARADLVELGVTQKAPGRVVVNVAISAEDLDRVQRQLRRRLRRKQDRA